MKLSALILNERVWHEQFIQIKIPHSKANPQVFESMMISFVIILVEFVSHILARDMNYADVPEVPMEKVAVRCVAYFSLDKD
jgi:hypothetical protein